MLRDSRNFINNLQNISDIAQETSITTLEIIKPLVNEPEYDLEKAKKCSMVSYYLAVWVTMLILVCDNKIKKKSLE